MTLELIILILALILAIVAINFAKGLIKLVLFVFMVITLFMTVFGVLLVKEAIEFKSGVESGNLKFIALSDEHIITGLSSEEGFKEFEVIKPDMIAKYDILFEDNKYSEMSAGAYKMFIIDVDSFSHLEDLPLNEEENINLPVETALTIVKSKNSREILADHMVLINTDKYPEGFEQEYKNVQMQLYETDENLRGEVFRFMFGNALNQDGPIFIIKKYKTGEMIVYPETILFKMMKFMPINYIGNIWQKEEIQE